MSSIFAGKRVRLRAVEEDDWEAHHEWSLDNRTDRLGGEIGFPASREGMRRWTEQESKNRAENDEFRFAIELLDGEFVGTIHTHTCHRRFGTFMYGVAILPLHQRRGYGSEAIGLVLRYYFQERRYQKVTAEVYAFNEGSIQLHEALGFTLEGRLRSMIYTGGEYHDVLVFGMTREEFDASEWMPPF